MKTKTTSIAIQKILYFFLIAVCSLHTGYSRTSDCISPEDYKPISEMQYMIRMHQSDLVMHYSDSILTKLESEGRIECEIAFWVYLIKGEIFEYSAEVHDAVELYHKVTPVATKNNWNKLLAETYISLGRCHEQVNRPLDAKRNLNEAMDIIEAHNLLGSKARLCMRTSSYYRIYEKRLDTAMTLALEAVKLGKKHNRPRAQTDGYMLLGMLEKDKRKRIEYYQKGKQVFIDTEVFLGAAVMSSSEAGVQIELGEFEQARKTIKESIQLQNKHVFLSGIHGPSHFMNMCKIHKIQSLLFEKENLLDSAKHHKKIAEDYAQKVKFKSDEKKVSQLEIQTAVEVEKIKSESLAKQLRRSKFETIFALLALLIFGGMLFIIYRNRNEIKNKNSLISAQISELSALNEKQGMLLSEVHHRVKNNLQNIVSLLTLQENKIKDTEAKTYISDVSNKIHSIALIHDQLYHENEFGRINMHKYISDLLNHFDSIKRGASEITSTVKINEVFLNLETVIPIGIICAELITNSLKYATKESILLIDITLNELDGNFSLSYKDNGPGFPANILQGKQTGMGMMLINSMARQLLTTVNIFNQSGANVTLNFQQKLVSKI